MMPVQGNKAQRELMEEFRELGLGSIIHHAVGRTIKKKGVGNIGHYFLVPCVSDEDHRAIHAAGKQRKTIEKARFSRACTQYERAHGRPVPLPDGVYDAIMDYSI